MQVQREWTLIISHGIQTVMAQSEPEGECETRPQPVRMSVYLLIGSAVGLAAAMVGGLISWIGSAGSRQTVDVHWIWVGIVWAGFGLASGYAVATYVRRRRRRRWRERMLRGQCVSCGYDLQANTSGCCPECGTPVCARAQPHGERDDPPRRILLLALVLSCVTAADIVAAAASEMSWLSLATATAVLLGALIYGFVRSWTPRRRS